MKKNIGQKVLLECESLKFFTFWKFFPIFFSFEDCFFHFFSFFNWLTIRLVPEIFEDVSQNHLENSFASNFGLSSRKNFSSFFIIAFFSLQSKVIFISKKICWQAMRARGFTVSRKIN